MTSTPEAGGPVPDERLLHAHAIAREALEEVTSAETIGEPAGHRVEADGVVSLRFANTMPGYPGWFWTVSVAVVADADPTVLEVELLPGDDALLAPDWVPWAVRLAEYQAQQAAEEASDDDDGDDDDADDDDADEADADDDADDVTPVLHAGDFDGVDIDELDESRDGSGDDEGADDDTVSDDTAADD